MDARGKSPRLNERGSFEAATTLQRETISAGSPRLNERGSFEAYLGRETAARVVGHHV